MPSSDIVVLTRVRGGAATWAQAEDAAAFASRGIRLAPSMVTDHSFGAYQSALDAAVLAIDGDASQHGGAEFGVEVSDDHEAKAV